MTCSLSSFHFAPILSFYFRRLVEVDILEGEAPRKISYKGIFTSASDYLRKATDGRVYFHRVVIVVPPMWDTRACGRVLPVGSFTSRSSYNDATIRIGTEHPVFGYLPWTQQSRGCGLGGDFISVGYHYILQFNETENSISGPGIEQEHSYGYGPAYSTTPTGFDAVPTERAFVHEWAKYRYGIFEEIGFTNDPIYPVNYTENNERKPTACSNSPLRGNWSGGCDESWNNERPNNRSATCKFTPASGYSHDNDRITSSIMSFPQLRNVRFFCDDTTHNRKAPTKQNFLCEGKSTAEVIYGHPDFRQLGFRDPSLSVPTPEFIVKQITQPRFVLLVEETGNMNLRDVWKFLKLAVRKFIKYDLPTGSQIGLITVSTNDVRVLANMTSLQSNTLRRALADKLPNYPNVDAGGNIALRRGIFAAVDVLKRNQQRAAGSVIILVSQGTVSNVDLEASLDLLRQEEVTLAGIEYPSLGDGKISILSDGTNGPHFVIRETGVGPTTHMSTYVQLINALMMIQKFFTEDVAASWPTMIHQAEYKGDSRAYIESNFSFEATAAQSPAEFFIYTSNPNDPKINSVELTSPNGAKFTTQLSDLHDINVIKIDAVINEPGVWRYRIERLADSHQSHFVQVVTKSTSEDLSVQLYTNVPTDRVANLSATPLILYVEVKRQNSPVIDADVEALIVTGNKKWTVRLLDNGNGDPDVTRGDGVYSRYFIVPSGVTATALEISSRIVVNPYRAKFIVVDQDPAVSKSLNPPLAQPCCGSFIAPADPKQQYKIVPFGERSSNSVTLKISDIPPIGFYPPGRIGDLTLGSMDPSNLMAELRWTAPGEDFDQGVVASYQVFYTVDKVNENWALLMEFTADLEAGVQDNVTITLPSHGSYKVSMRGVDFYSKTGKMSNILKLSIYLPPKELDHTNNPNALGTGSGNSLSSTGSTMAPSTDDFSKYELLIIIICGVIFIILLGGLIVVLLYCRKVGSSQRKSSKKNPGDTKISAITDSKSPIHWSASELLGEHEKTQRHSLYGGSVSPGSGSDPSKGHPGRHHGASPPHDLNILPGSEYVATSSRSRSSPDSYDDPDSPTPVPVSVRNRADYAICIDRDARNSDSRNSYGHPHYQTPQNNGGLMTGGGVHHPHFNGYVNAAAMNVVNPVNGRFSTVMNSSTSSNSPLPPPPHNASHLMHYDPEIQGSMSSVNSKKRNITMV
ncbi:unnamed protein product [Allacma fusca]|uniref:VWFA domain-containing protein n=1 Tax=Allacma fusca TaxID=39272 RepID=A0A8J2PKQ6_9HEXA|nr:unnamed protein product [Allacma fusca]